jgi:membrane-bound lytic murein transglycosylase D
MSRHRNLHRRLTILAIAGVSLLSSACAPALAAAAPAQKQKKKKGAELVPPAPPTLFLLDTLRPGPWTTFPLPVVPLPPDPVKELLSKVQAAYKSGVEAYQSGHLGKARTEFDQSLELMLTSGFDLRTNPVLEREYESLVDNIHSFEVSALSEGDGFTERKPVQAAIDEVADIDLPQIDVRQVDARLRDLVEHGLRDTHSDLPLVLNDEVLRYINYFSNRGRGGIQAGWRRAGRYRGMIERVLREEGVPLDLIYLAQAESAFHPTALSRAGARGMWQFMAYTGKLYGLESNWWVDSRQDPETATRAAAHHLHDLYRQFGDWYLAMAAYNSGPLNVSRAIERTGYADFWELYHRNQLPKETRNYVPIILAVTIMAKNPAAYGLTDVEPDPAVPSETVTLTTPTDLRLIAETIDCTVEQLQDLNPSLLRWVTPKLDQFQLRLPAGTRDRFLEQIAAIPEDKRVWWRWHRVAEGESLALIAKNYKTTASAIAEVNNLADVKTADLAPGSRLVIPITPKNPSLLAAAMEGSKNRMVSLRYKVRKGDSLAVVADRFGVDKDDVIKWNSLKTSSLAPGKVLTIRAVESAPSAVASAHKKPGQRSATLTASAAHRASPTPVKRAMAKNIPAKNPLHKASKPAPKLVAKGSAAGPSAGVSEH